MEANWTPGGGLVKDGEGLGRMRMARVGGQVKGTVAGGQANGMVDVGAREATGLAGGANIGIAVVGKRGGNGGRIVERGGTATAGAAAAAAVAYVFELETAVEVGRGPKRSSR